MKLQQLLTFVFGQSILIILLTYLLTYLLISHCSFYSVLVSYLFAAPVLIHANKF